MKVNIIDGIMGLGKTSWAIEKINADKVNNYLYITPYLPECDRIKAQCKSKRFRDPNAKVGKGSKRAHFKELIAQDHNIVSTHSLFKGLDKETIDLLKVKNYVLVLDEVMDVVEELEIKKDDLDLLKSEFVNIKDGCILEWKEEKKDYTGEKFSLEKKMCEHGNLILIEDKVIIWNFPVEVFQYFKDIYILTYMFEAQIQRYYFDFYNIEYNFYTVDKDQEGLYKLVDKGVSLFEAEKKKQVKGLLTIQDGKYNLIGEDRFDLSKNWFINNPVLVQELKRNLFNYFKNQACTKSNENGWTTFSGYEDQLKGDRYKKGFIAVNMRASNEYRDKKAMAYCANRFVKPYILKMFKYRNIEMDQDKWALSEMLQWIWRGSIRKNEPMKLYIPSYRMRNLFERWLNNEI
jgi:hypothetical protein